MTSHTVDQPHLAHPIYRADIDGLRAVAILSVVAYHAFPAWVKGGFVGVDVFFVISGFLISTIIFGSLDKDAFSFKEFYARRIKRIFPALIMVMTACYALGWFVLLPDEYKQLGKHIAAGAGFVSNLFLWQEAGYFDSAAESKPMLHLWSLGIEEQFYIVWPLLLFLTWKRRFNLLLFTIAIIAISFAVNISKVHSDAVQAFYSPVSRFWELMIGSALAYLTLHKVSLWNWAKQQIGATSSITPTQSSLALRNAQSLIGGILIGVAVFVVSRETAFPGWWVLLPTFGACLVISAGQHAWINQVVLSHRAMVWLGLLSYPFYLWHWPLLSFARIVESGTPSIAIRLAAVFIALALAWLTYKFVEIPIRFGRRGRGKIAMLCILTAAIGCAGFGTYKYEGFRFRHDIGKFQDLELDQYEKLSYSDECQAVLSPTYPDHCVRSSDRAPSHAIFGDSHALVLFPGIAKQDENNSWLLIGNDGCPPVSGISVTSPNPQSQYCQQKSEKSLEFLLNTPSINTVVLSFFGNYILNTSFSADHKVNHFGPEEYEISQPGSGASQNNRLDINLKVSLFFQGLENAVKLLEQRGKSIIVIIDVSELPFFPRDCINRPARISQNRVCKLPKSVALERQKELRGMLNKLVAAHPKIRLYDPFNLLCDEEFCNFENDNMLFYEDSHHLSVRGSAFFAIDFLKWMSKT